MSKLPQITPKQIIKLLLKKGFIRMRQVGSHERFAHADGRKVTVAIHNRSIAPGTLQSILKQANLSRSEFLRLLKSK